MRMSIITASYNSIKYIPNTFESLYKQTFQNIEHIVVDGGSTDGTVTYLKNNSRISQFISEKDNGLYDALNKGLKAATGEIIGFLHSDDILASNLTLQNIAFAFNSFDPITGKKPDIVYGDLVFVDPGDTNRVIRYWRSNPFRRESLRQGWMPPHPSIFMNKSVYIKHGFFDIKYKCAADYDFILRVFHDESLTIKYIPEILIKMRLGGVSTGGIRNMINKSKEDYSVLRNHKMPNPLWIMFLKNITKIPQLFSNNPN